MSRKIVFMHNLGRQIDDFRITERLALHDSTTVYRASQQAVDREVALKVIALGSSDDLVTKRADFLQAAGKIAALEYLHILPIYSYGVVDDHTVYIAMRLMRGGSLERYIPVTYGAPLSVQRELTNEKVERIFAQVADALIFAHRSGIVHGNLKPSNVLLDEQFNAYVSDFALPAIDRPENDDTFYLAPRTNAPCDPRCDVYGLGIVITHILTNQPPPYKDSHLMVQSSMPEAVANAVLRAIEPDPDQRFASVEAFKTAFEQSVQAQRPAPRRPTALSVAQLPAVRVKTQFTEKTQPRMHVGAGRRQPLPLLRVAALIAVLAVALLFVMINRAAPLQATPPRVLIDQAGTADDLALTPADIEQARTVLGSDGFIAVITCRLDSEIQAARARELVDAARRDGLALRLYDSQMDAYQQGAQIERARAEGAKAIILCRLGDASDGALEALEQDHFPLVLQALNDRLFGGVVTGEDNFVLAYNAGRYGGQLIADANDGRASAVIFGFTSVPLGARTLGLQAGLIDAAPNVEFMGVMRGSTHDEAKASTMSLIERDRLPDLILCFSDTAAYGAIEALEANDISPNAVHIVSINGENLARDYVARGYYLRATQSIDRTLVSQMAYNATVKLLSGEPVPQLLLIPPGQLFTTPSSDTSPNVE